MAEYRLIIMRHAKSDWNTDAGKDFNRPLSLRGERDAPKMGDWLRQQQFTPHCILSSPALRAKQTCLAVAGELDMSEEDIIWKDNIYEAGIKDLCSIIDEHADGINTLMMIGHNPGLEGLLYYLSQDKPPYNDRGKVLTTAAIAVLNYGDQAINSSRAGTRLETFVRPGELGQG